MENQKQRAERLIGSFLLCILSVLLIRHCRLSFCQTDESFYLALAHRLWSGDRMILDEWNAAQVYSPILLPFYALYRLIIPDGTGVYLYARILYVLFATAVSVLFYQKSRTSNSSSMLSWTAAAMLLLYSRANICGPSYYNLSLQFAATSALLLWKSGNNYHVAENIFAGVFLTLTVICNPYFSFFVLSILGYMGINPKTRRRFWGIAAGAALAALVYFLYLLRSGNPLTLLKSHPPFAYIPFSFGGVLFNLNKIWIRYLRYASRYVFPLTMIGVLITIWDWKKKKQAGSLPRFLYYFLCLLFVGFTASKSKISICFVITVPFAILVFPEVIRAFLFRSNDFAVIVYVFGVALAIAFFFASNTGLDAMTTGFCLSSAGGLLLLADEPGKEKDTSAKNNIRILYKGVCVSLCLLLISVFSVHRFLGIYRDAPVSQLIQRIEKGPAAGLYTTKSHAEEYNAIIDEITKIHEKYPTAGVLFSKSLPWAYLVSDWKCAVFTVWMSPLSDLRLEQYYQTHQEPDIVFVLDERVASFETIPFSNLRGVQQYNQNEFEGPFYDHMIETYEIIENNDYCTVYMKRPGI
ncbi:MAG: hypothetical protein IKS55_12640 [Oscillospiraceae bacterium]|nr:hypothetical protein [Oscillospiraceae bacterium]